jgi:hypothetical protein
MLASLFVEGEKVWKLGRHERGRRMMQTNEAKKMDEK